mmetsp:Transcript_7288/g.21516  ORF Transcript_7288/g.21516 Transcript_7288/m.21516 type:complete len:429 (-) Transcript_7288:98-1384(-)|eukprot:CAMPEP_0119268554 /NCGR_PEP_ID=MMETSP1329-20130426/6296_1 /TAXON_ID=114041 /ORGANISM="Genus nov. species nov., Strain RCC1024" /LENGTH=428 /DNA_ID=CAMNT_0007268531 /DNA_START=77 /DNA_END=1363 /DNA_ORIENTATION=+
MEEFMTPMAMGALAVGAAGAAVVFSKSKGISRDGSGGTGASFDGQLSAGVNMLSNSDSVLKRSEVEASIDTYADLFGGKTGKHSLNGLTSEAGELTSSESIEKRREGYRTMVNNFYDLVTDFYEYGWCQSFHFGPRLKGETFLESIKRAEYYLCSRLGMKPGMKVLDVGCGVGGPMRNMAAFSGSTIEGITINQYQVNVGNKYCKQTGLEKIAHLTRGDFQNMPGFSNGKLWEGIEYGDADWTGKFDAAYEIEATCHSPDKTRCYSEVARCLKAGGLYAGYEWVVLPERGYDASDPTHVAIKEGIEIGNGLPTLATPEAVVEALEAAGFEVLEHFDANQNVHAENEIPWYETLDGKMSLSGFRMTRLGRACTHAMVTVLETLRIAPKGTVHVSAMLNATAIDLVEGGKREIFTPSYFFLARKKGMLGF